MDAFAELFRPGRINRLELKNRFIMAATGNALADDEGFVTDRAIDYYVERARGGVGLVIVKFTSVIANARGSRNHMAAFDDKFIPRLRDLSSAVQRHGARVLILMDSSPLRKLKNRDRLTPLEKGLDVPKGLCHASGPVSLAGF